MTKSLGETPINQQTYRFRPRRRGGNKTTLTITLSPEIYGALMATSRKLKCSRSKVIEGILMASDTLKDGIKEHMDYQQKAQATLKNASFDLLISKRRRR
jgi:hypothetical protein